MSRLGTGLFHKFEFLKQTCVVEVAMLQHARRLQYSGHVMARLIQKLASSSDFFSVGHHPTQDSDLQHANPPQIHFCDAAYDSYEFPVLGIFKT